MVEQFYNVLSEGFYWLHHQDTMTCDNMTYVTSVSQRHVGRSGHRRWAGDHRSLGGRAGTETRHLVGLPEPTFESLPPEVVGESELEQGSEDESGARAHPDVDGLEGKHKHLYQSETLLKYLLATRQY